MPNRDDILRSKTHKDQGVDTDTRVFYSLAGSGDPDFAKLSQDSQLRLQVHRNSKLLAMLVARLESEGTLAADDLDDMLFDVVTG